MTTFLRQRWWFTSVLLGFNMLDCFFKPVSVLSVSPTLFLCLMKDKNLIPIRVKPSLLQDHVFKHGRLRNEKLLTASGLNNLLPVETYESLLPVCLVKSRCWFFPARLWCLESQHRYAHRLIARSSWTATAPRGVLKNYGDSSTPVSYKGSWCSRALNLHSWSYGLTWSFKILLNLKCPLCQSQVSAHTRPQIQLQINPMLNAFIEKQQ